MSNIREIAKRLDSGLGYSQKSVEQLVREHAEKYGNYYVEWLRKTS